ncbi:hypothetical protein V5O48_010600 [Marasmius crinis-equi]|uniref:F-box domain-containing protein n=1 Tax=Marasmius crinis-equi TaxID=585013 RepID=A0ABR3F7Y7_9AGAR
MEIAGGRLCLEGRSTEDEHLDFDNEDAVKGKIAELEDTVREYQYRIEHLRMSLNRFGPTHRLPNEILALIFGYCVMEGRTPDTHTKPKWLGFTAVCRYWRVVALNTPALWTTPHFHNGGLALAMVERSYPLPMAIDAHISLWTTRGVRVALQKIFQQAFRISHLRLSIRSGTNLNNLLPEHSLQEPAPLLRVMELHITPRDGVHSHSFKIPKDMWGRTAPNLKHLSLRGCYIDNSSPLLRNLTYLHLDMRTSHRAVNYKRLVSHVPLLEHLELCIGTRMSDPANESAVQLRHLKHFYLCGDMLGCAFLLNQFSYPDSTSIHVEVMFMKCQARFQVDNVFLIFLSSLSVFIPLQPRIRSLLIEGYDEEWMQLKGWASPSGASMLEDLTSMKPQLCLSFNHPHREHRPTWDNVLYGVLSSPLRASIEALECLSFRTDSRLFKAPLKTILQCFGNHPVLHTIELLDYLHPAAVTALGDDTSLGRAPLGAFQTLWQDMPSAELYAGMSFPKLRTLYLEGIHLADSDAPTNAFNALLGSLRFRMPYDLTVELVLTKDCDLDTKQVRSMEEVAVRVRCLDP